MCFPQLRVALVSLVYPFGDFSETKIASDIYRVSFSPYGYTSWDLAYQTGLLRCATLSR
jgi:hypothetical protein